MMLRAVTGKETFNTGMCQYNLMLVPTTAFPVAQRSFLTALRDVVLPGGKTVRIINWHRQPACAGSMVDMGTWHEVTYDLPDGMILFLSGSRSMAPSSYGGRGSGLAFKQTEAMVLQTRASAALQRIRCLQTLDPKSTFRNVTVEGRFDILSTRDMSLVPGLRLTMADMKSIQNYKPSGGLFALEQIDGEISARKTIQTTTVVNDEGEKVKVQTVMRKRALDLD